MDSSLPTINGFNFVFFFFLDDMQCLGYGLRRSVASLGILLAEVTICILWVHTI
jgi:hypothetical protein